MMTEKQNASFPVRNQDFDFDDVVRHWVDNDPFMTHTFNALSSLFPDGEKFFVASVRAVQDKVKDPQLARDIRAFIGQEAMHAREHHEFNTGDHLNGLDLSRLERFTRRFLSTASLPVFNSPRMHLAITVALEHFTGILSARLMRREDLVSQIAPNMRTLWLWHCIEENEHKAVAFDAFKEVYGDGPDNYIVRMSAMVFSTVLIMVAIHAFIAELMRQDGHLLNGRSWFKGLSRLWGRNGVFSQIIPEYLDYFRPGFHPWQHDTAYLIDRWRSSLSIK